MFPSAIEELGLATYGGSDEAPEAIFRSNGPGVGALPLAGASATSSW